MSTDCHLKYPLFSSDFNGTWIFPTHFLKILKYQIPRKSVQWEPSCFKRTDERTERWTDGRTDRHIDRQTDRHDEPIVAFHDFVCAPKNGITCGKFESSNFITVNNTPRIKPVKLKLGKMLQLQRAIIRPTTERSPGTFSEYALYEIPFSLQY
jgi:hypothetical protein